MKFKDIHIGTFIFERVQQLQIDVVRLCRFLNTTEDDILKTYESKDIEASSLLRWSKVLDYDFFRIYSQHLILYAPAGRTVQNNKNKSIASGPPQFRKNIYSKELIDFILGLITSGKMTKTEIINEYKIPKTTLGRWLTKNT